MDKKKYVGDYPNIADCPREQLEEEYRSTQYFLGRILKGTGVTCQSIGLNGFRFVIGPDPVPQHVRIYFGISEDMDYTTLEVKPV